MSQAKVYIVQGAARQAAATDVLKNYQENPFHELKDIRDLDNRVVRKIAGWRDPFTPPHTKLDCVGMCSITPWDKWCCQWALRTQWMDCELFVEVRTASPQDIVSALEDCLREGAVASAIAAIVTAVFTGGAAVPAAKAAFIATLTACLTAKLPEIISIQLFEACGWSDWE